MELNCVGLISLLYVIGVYSMNLHHVDKRSLVVNTSPSATSSSMYSVQVLKSLLSIGLVGEQTLQMLLNKFADGLYSKIQNSIKTNNLSTIAIPPVNIEFSPILPGKIAIKNGALGDLSKLFKYQNPKVTYKSKTEIITIEFFVEFKILQFYCDYSTEILFLRRKEGVIGKIENLKGSVLLNLNLDKLEAVVKDIKIINAGRISVRFFGHILSDWVKNIISLTITTLLHRLIVHIIKEMAKNNLNASISQINKEINKIIKA